MKFFKNILLLSFLSVALFGCFAPEYEKEDETIYVYVNSYKVGSLVSAEKTSYLVKEKENEDWDIFDGVFTSYQPKFGYSYELKVLKNSIINLNTDETTLQYTVEKIISEDKLNEESELTITLSNEIHNWLSYDVENDQFYFGKDIKLIIDATADGFKNIKQPLLDKIGKYSSTEYIATCTLSAENMSYHILSLEIIEHN